jgi:5-oxopent-3-ene-1,2,5-tricarboxylate decarboxylase / 2-hydroxyhepta-2,4-diene-1,7-dioate isomerase
MRSMGGADAGHVLQRDVMIAGTAYGVALNDRRALARRMAESGDRPVAPILYIKPRNTFVASGAAVTVPADVPELEIGATLALLFGDRPGVPVGAALAIDLCEPHDSLYRPAIRQRCRDGFLPIGRFGIWSEACAELAITTFIDDLAVYQWPLAELVRDPMALAGEIGGFMTLADGDLLLAGLPDNPPRARAGQSVRVEAPGFSPVEVRLVDGAAS